MKSNKREFTVFIRELISGPNLAGWRRSVGGAVEEVVEEHLDPVFHLILPDDCQKLSCSFIYQKIGEPREKSQ